MAKTFSDYYDEFLKATKADAEKQKAALTEKYNLQEQIVNDQFNDQAASLDEEYEQLQRNNEIQRHINERQIRENMANMGLEKSGLNLTQQTALQLSSANNSANISKQKQKAVESLALAIRQQISTIKQNRISSEAAIDESYSNAATNWANNAIEHASNAKSTEVSQTSEKVGNGGTGSGLLTGGYSHYEISTNGNVIHYDKNGNSVKVAQYHNPYNNKYNADALNGTFNNGYQPNNIKGTPLIQSKTNGIGDTMTVTLADGTKREQKIWTTTENGKTRYWVWVNADNAYKEVGFYLNGKEVSKGTPNAKINWK